MRQRLRRIVRRHPEAATVSMVVLISLAFAIITRGSWLSVGNLQALSQITAVLAIMAFGQALVIATAEIDISVGSVCGVGALVFLGLAPLIGSALALLGALVCGILIGALNGVFIALIGVPSLLVTLGTLFLFQGVAYAVTAGFSFVATKAVRQEFVYSAVGGGDFAGVNAAIFWALIVLLVLHVVVFKTPVGNRILAIGGDAASSFSRGREGWKNQTWSFCCQRIARSVCRSVGCRLHRLCGRQLRRNDGAFGDRRRSSRRVPFGGRSNFTHRHTPGSLYAAGHPEFSNPAGRPAPMVHPRCRPDRRPGEFGGSNSDQIGSQRVTSTVEIVSVREKTTWTIEPIAPSLDCERLQIAEN